MLDSDQKALQRAKEVSQILENLLTKYSTQHYFGSVTFTLSFQGGLIVSGRHGTEKQLPIKRD